MSPGFDDSRDDALEESFSFFLRRVADLLARERHDLDAVEPIEIARVPHVLDRTPPALGRHSVPSYVAARVRDGLLVEGRGAPTLGVVEDRVVVADPPTCARLEPADPADAPYDLALEGRLPRPEHLVEDDLRVVSDVRVEVDVEAAALRQEVVQEQRDLVEPREPRVEPARVVVGRHGDTRAAQRRDRREEVERSPGIERRVDVHERDLSSQLGQRASRIRSAVPSTRRFIQREAAPCTLVRSKQTPASTARAPLPSPDELRHDGRS